MFNGLLSISGGTHISMYGATFKLINSGNANSGFVCGPTTQLGGPIDNVKWFGGTIDGNRTNQTNTLGSGAGLYCVSVTNFYAVNLSINNWRTDGYYFGGDSGGAGQSVYVTLVNPTATGNYRNNMSIVGVLRMSVFGGKFNSASNTNNDGPQCGVDIEPNGATTANAGIHFYGTTANGNGYPTFSATGGSGFSVLGSNNTDIDFFGVDANSNHNFGIQGSASSTSYINRPIGTTGSGNTNGLIDTASGVRDYIPQGITLGAPDSGGTGFRQVIVPN
jgi:hypothetical protein